MSPIRRYACDREERPNCSPRYRCRLPSPIGLSLLVGFAWLSVGPVVLARGAADDKAQVREQIETYWRGFDNVQLETTETYDCDDDRHDERKEIRFAWDSDGRSALFVKRTLPNSVIRHDVRQDRTKACRLSYFDGPTPAINTILVQPPWNGPGEYRGQRFMSLWALLPGGKTPARLLADGATLSRSSPLATHRWSLAGEVEGIRLECVLDEQHAYLPISLTFTSKEFDGRIEVDQFERQNEFWWPARGHGTLTTRLLEGTFTSAHQFAVEEVRFNETIPASRFEMPTPTTGAEISDLLTKSTRIEGGQYAREKLKQRFPPAKQRRPDGPTVRVPPTTGQEGSWLPPILIAIGLLTGLVAVGLMLRKR